MIEYENINGYQSNCNSVDTGLDPISETESVPNYYTTATTNNATNNNNNNSIVTPINNSHNNNSYNNNHINNNNQDNNHNNNTILRHKQYPEITASILYLQQQQARLLKYHAQRPVFVSNPAFGLKEFDLLEILGTGTFGKVMLTKFKTTNKYYAMKVLKKSEIIRLKQVDHILNEKQILASIRFPFIVELFCTFQDDHNLHMLLEYVVGGELFTHLRRAGRFTNDMTRFYASEIVLSIEYLHNKNIIYRDLKPENLLIDSQGHIKITDFGFAKTVRDQTWTLCGTPEYLAPEIIQSKGHGKAVDWWSLGILIFEMLAGYPPFFDDNSFGIYEKILLGKVQFPSHFDPLAKDLLKRLLVGDRNKRLGNLKNGPEDVKRHKWFRGVDWIGLLDKTVRPPIIPTYRHPGDTNNFEKYDDVDTDICSSDNQGNHELYEDLFSDFS